MEIEVDTTCTVSFDGFEIDIYRSKQDGSLLIHVDSSETSPPDHHDGGVPRLRLGINDEYADLNEYGRWDPTPPR